MKGVQLEGDVYLSLNSFFSTDFIGAIFRLNKKTVRPKIIVKTVCAENLLQKIVQEIL